jgi:hypothetical protein
MALGYALLAQELTIKGRASIDSRWKVEITDINSKDIIGDAVNKVDPSYTATTASFSVGFTQPGDSITYDITVTNKGTLDAVVENITVNKGNNSAIKYTTSGLKRGDKITKNNGTNTLTVKVDYDSSVTSQPASTTNNITVTINYQQDLGQVPAYEAYSIGDTVQFAGSNWKVIKASTAEEDYVTIMKKTVLTNSELGSYAYNSTYDTMEYTWTDNCHHNNHGYSSYDTSNCDNTNGYGTSKVKEMLETRYLPTIGESNLKEVDGYKIRLITVDELTSNLGCTSSSCSSSPYASWVYQNFGDKSKNVYGYWTMTPHPDYSYRVLSVASLGQVSSYYHVGGSGSGVRPVINLLKSNIS